MVGQKFGKLMVIENGTKPHYWLCVCDCGNKSEFYKYNLIKGKSRSCGCRRTDIAKHRHHGTLVYNTWDSMKQRCTNPNSQEYKYYGGRGITICDRWLNNFSNFLEDMGERPFPKAQIDRINNNGDYKPDNCRWVTGTENNRNKRGVKINVTIARLIKRLLETKEMTCIEIAELFGVKKHIVGDISAKRSWQD